MPQPLAHASAFVLDGRVFVAGGVEDRTPLALVYEIHTATGVAAIAATLPGPRSDAAVVGVGDETWLIGGEDRGPSAPLDTVVALRLVR